MCLVWLVNLFFLVFNYVELGTSHLDLFGTVAQFTQSFPLNKSTFWSKKGNSL